MPINRIKELRSSPDSAGNHEAQEPAPIKDQEQLLHLFRIHKFLSDKTAQQQRAGDQAEGVATLEANLGSTFDTNLVGLKRRLDKRADDYRNNTLLNELLNALRESDVTIITQYALDWVERRYEEDEEKSESRDTSMDEGGSEGSTAGSATDEEAGEESRETESQAAAGEAGNQQPGKIQVILEQLPEGIISRMLKLAAPDRPLAEASSISGVSGSGTQVQQLFNILRDYFESKAAPAPADGPQTETELTNLQGYIQEELSRIQKDLGFIPFNALKRESEESAVGTAGATAKTKRYAAPKTDAERAEIVRRLLAMYNELTPAGLGDDTHAAGAVPKEVNIVGILKKLQELLPEDLYSKLLENIDRLTQLQGEGEGKQRTESDGIQDIIKVALVRIMTPNTDNYLTEEEKNYILSKEVLGMFGLQGQIMVDGDEVNCLNYYLNRTTEYNQENFLSCIKHMIEDDTQISMSKGAFDKLEQIKAEELTKGEVLDRKLNTKGMLSTFLNKTSQCDPLLVLAMTAYCDGSFYYFYDNGKGFQQNLRGLIGLAREAMKEYLEGEEGTRQVPQYYQDFLEVLEYYNNNGNTAITLADAERYFKLREQYRLWQQQAQREANTGVAGTAVADTTPTVTRALNTAMTKMLLEQGENVPSMTKYTTSVFNTIFTIKDSEVGSTPSTASQAQPDITELANKYMAVNESENGQDVAASATSSTSTPKLSPEVLQYMREQAAKTALTTRSLYQLMTAEEQEGNELEKFGIKKLDPAQQTGEGVAPAATVAPTPAPQTIDKGIEFTPPTGDDDSGRSKLVNNLKQAANRDKSSINRQTAVEAAKKGGEDAELYGDFLDNIGDMLKAAVVVHESKVAEFTLLTAKLYLLQQLQEKAKELESAAEQAERIKAELEKVNHTLEFEKQRYKDMLMEIASTTCLMVHLEKGGKKELVKVDGGWKSEGKVPDHVIENRKVIAESFNNIVANFLAQKATQEKLKSISSTENLAKAINEFQENQDRSRDASRNKGGGQTHQTVGDHPAQEPPATAEAAVEDPAEAEAPAQALAPPPSVRSRPAPDSFTGPAEARSFEPSLLEPLAGPLPPLDGGEQPAPRSGTDPQQSFLSQGGVWGIEDDWDAGGPPLDGFPTQHGVLSSGWGASAAAPRARVGARGSFGPSTHGRTPGFGAPPPNPGPPPARRSGAAAVPAARSSRHRGGSSTSLSARSLDSAL